MVKNLPVMQKKQVPYLGGEDLKPVFLPEESHRQRSLAGYSPWGCKELDKTETNTFTFTGLGYVPRDKVILN